MAIAYNTSVQGQQNSVDPLTVAITPSGANLVLVMYTATQNAAGGTGSVTVNGSAATLIDTQTNRDRVSLWYYVGPNSGSSNSAVFSPGAGGWNAMSIASYTGVSQTAPINISGKGSSSAPSVVTTVDGCFAVVGAMNNAGGAPTAGSGLTRRQVTFDDEAQFDSNTPQTSAGTYTVNLGESDDWIMGALAPVPPATVKTINGLALASVKTVNGLAIASVKTVNDLSTT